MDHRMAIIRRAAVTTPSLEKASEPLSGLTSKIIAEHQLGSGNTLLCTTYAGVGDFQVNTVTLEGNAHLVFESTNAFGINKDFMLNFGTFSAAEHGSWTAADTLTSGPKTTPSPSLKHWTWAAFPEPATATLGLLGLEALLLRRRRK